MNIKKLLFVCCSTLVILLLVLPLAYSYAQDADDNYPQGADPCAGSANPIQFHLSPDTGPAGSSFLIQGKPHDPSVGRGSGVAFSWREKVNDQGFFAQVGTDGSFVTLIKVPSDFTVGDHQLMYEEGSPYVQCLTFTVTSGEQGAVIDPVRSGLGPLAKLLALFMEAVRLVTHPY